MPSVLHFRVLKMLWSFLLENGLYQIPSDHTVRILVVCMYVNLYLNTGNHQLSLS